MVTLLLVRHGEAVGNNEHRFIGQTDVELTAAGHEQVGRLTDRLARRAISRVVSSDLQRCRDTVAPAAAALGLALETDPRFREISNGDWNGLLPSEIEHRWPDLFRRYRSGEDVARPGGERWSDVAERVRAGLEDLVASASAGDTVLIGTHAGPTMAAIRWATGSGLEGNVFRGPFSSAGNTSITTLVFPGPRISGFNDLAHLESH